MLFATHASPLPLISGDRLRSYHLMRGLTDLGWRVSLFTLAGDELGRDERLALEGLCDQLHVERTPRPRARFARAALQVVRNRAFQQTFFLRPHARDSLHHWLGGRPFDAIVVGTLYMLAYVPRSLYGSILLDSHNSEALRIASMAEAGGLSPRGVAARLQRGAVLRYERDAVRSVSRTVAVSETEQAELERHAPGRVDLVPNGVDCQALRPRDTVPPGRDVLFVGSLDYGPNVDALEHLVDDVMPLVRGDARLLVVGSNPRPAARRAAARAP
ncbi:MAG: glycosyltransferase, partial [Gaiellales bacterium]